MSEWFSLEAFNPLKYLPQQTYADFWETMFITMLSGFWARFFATAFLVAAFWMAVYRRRFGLGIALFFMSVSITYLGGVLGLIFW
ncbi:MAG: hypothetical protein RBT20_00090 [Syntrophales bacterium]|jgi:hypothetical protein|nr:hypothetical protein [Candidatus Omnitrophota bacterium]MDX9820309.1 hypothetical protein [Syntrophales bacterium]